MLSVICPIYNEEKYIAQFLDSLLQQDYPQDDLEILLVDGMSKDKTRDIVAEYTAQYPFIRLIDKCKRKNTKYLERNFISIKKILNLQTILDNYPDNINLRNINSYAK